jgi:hypothetical protein
MFRESLLLLPNYDPSTVFWQIGSSAALGVILHQMEPSGIEPPTPALQKRRFERRNASNFADSTVLSASVQANYNECC